MAGMRIVEFNGYGEPSDPSVGTGAVLVLVQEERVSVVRLRVLPPDEYGPELTRASNWRELEVDVRRVIADALPTTFPTDRAWVLTCPQEIASRARFPGD